MQHDSLYAARRRHEQLLKLNIDDKYRKQHGVWCVFFDTLVEFMGFPVELYAPGLDHLDALNGVFRADTDNDTLWGTATFSMSHEADSAVVPVSFGVSPTKENQPTWWTIPTSDGKVKGFFDNASPQANQKLLRDAKEAIRQAIVGSA